MIIYEIRPLPDFLADHTLVSMTGRDRLSEVIERWTGLLAVLHVWADRATFGLRFISRDGRIGVFLVAAPSDPQSSVELRCEIDALLRAHRLVLEPASRRVSAGDFRRESMLAKPVFCTIAQQPVEGLWTQPPRFVNGPEAQSLSQLVTPDQWQSPSVILPWKGPGGPFLVPLETLLSQPIPAVLTVYLAPTRLRSAEFTWLRHMAMASQSVSDEMIQRVGAGAAARQADPASALAAALYDVMLRRLSSTVSMCVAQVAADFERVDVLRSVAAAVKSQALMSPLDSTGDDGSDLPSGSADLILGTSTVDAQRSQAAIYHDFDLNAAVSSRGALGRLPLLVNAKSAATMFRLPISVRGGVPGVEVRQLPPDFRPGPRQMAASPDSIIVGRFRDGGVADIAVRDLTRHALITGFTGTGKTVTVLQLLHQLWIDHDVPFLVLESAKAEYRGLTQVHAFQDKSRPLRVYTLGNERGIPMRLNPFELLPGVRVEAHISRLQSCIEGAIPPVGPSSSLIAEALVQAYADCGWLITDRAPTSGRPRRPMPTLSGFVDTIEHILAGRGYRGELLDNLQAALVGRFKPLLMGGKGRMFGTQRSDPPLETLFREPVVLEMNDLNLDDKALVTTFVLTLLREFRELHRGDGESLEHLTVVEEAHNVLENVGSAGGGENATSADTRFKAVQAFCTMLTEIRSLGEGIIIADQSPQKLARDAVRNTNLQLAHQLRDADDRNAISTAMIMEPEQRDYLGKLDRGHAAFFRTGLEKATFVKIDQYYPNRSQIAELPDSQLSRRFRGLGFRTDLGDDELIAIMRQVDGTDRSRIELPFAGCVFCTSRCDEAYRDAMFARSLRAETLERFNAWFELISDRRKMAAQAIDVAAALRIAAELCRDAMLDEDLAPHIDAGWCFFVHAWARASDEYVNQTGAEPAASSLRSGHRQAFECAWAAL